MSKDFIWFSMFMSKSLFSKLKFNRKFEQKGFTEKNFSLNSLRKSIQAGLLICPRYSMFKLRKDFYFSLQQVALHVPKSKNENTETASVWRYFAVLLVNLKKSLGHMFLVQLFKRPVTLNDISLTENPK